MTENESIHELNAQRTVLESMILYNKDFEPKSDNSSLEIRKEAIEIAVQSLTEIQQYQANGTVEECRAAVDKPLTETDSKRTETHENTRV